jgi:SAM-dependent methyltransferase
MSPTLGQRILQLLDELDLPRAHFCLRATADLAEIGATAADRIASVVVSGAFGSPGSLRPVLDRTLWIQGDEGASAKGVAGELAALGEVNVRWLTGYPNLVWSDTAAERTAEVSDAMLSFFSEGHGAAPLRPAVVSGEGEIAGVTYRAAGTGPPLLLYPLGLASHQWDPLLSLLQARYCTIVLGGKYLIPVSQLEDRAAGDYSRMALDCLNLAAPAPRESLLEVGCGSGALLRRIVQRTGLQRVSGLDVNPFLLQEARVLAQAEALSDHVMFREGSVEAIPFPDGAFDLVFSSTMLEEVDADRALAEMVRVVKPGGRVVVVVRSVDLPKWTNLPLAKPILDTAMQPGGAVTDTGCADGSLSRRLHDAGLKQVRGGPTWSWAHLGDPYWPYQESGVLRNLAPEDAEAWRSALSAAQAGGWPISIAMPHHCALGTR